MGRNSYRGFDVLQQVIGVYVGQTVLGRMVIWIKFAILVILNLDGSRDPLLTEGSLITSGTSCDDTRY